MAEHRSQERTGRLARWVAELVSKRVRRLRRLVRPRMGVTRNGCGVARESVEDEVSPARADVKS
jgi:hypothetical protein